MENLLRKLKLKDNIIITVPIMKSDFINKLRRNMDEGSTSTTFAFTEAFSRSKHNYIGSISGNEFELRRRLRFFDANKGKAIAKGKMQQDGDNLIIDVEVNGFKKSMIFFYVAITFFYVFFFGMAGFFSFSDSEHSNVPFFFIPFILLHGIMMYFIPIYVMRRSVKNIKNDLEKDFFYFTK